MLMSEIGRLYMSQLLTEEFSQGLFSICATHKCDCELSTDPEPMTALSLLESTTAVMYFKYMPNAQPC